MEQEPTFKRLREYQESVPPFTRRLYLYAKYGIRDYRGGGRSSARETISRVVAGALAKLALKQLGISVTAYTSQVGPVKLDKDYKSYNLDLIETNDVRCPDPEKPRKWQNLSGKSKEKAIQ